MVHGNGGNSHRQLPAQRTVGYYSKRYINDEEGHITYCDGNHGTTEPTA